MIEGGTGASADRGVLEAMTATLIHRGPDQDGFYLEGNVGLGMRRLSIVDLDHGRQPIYNEDKSIVVVFNGEIYNHAELRGELEARGHSFRTRTDTEVIVHLYEEHGEDFVRHLNGMFAIALWDMAAQKLVVVRDRIGIKPLYYYERNGSLVFGSELKAVVAHPAVPRDVDPVGLDSFLRTSYIPAPNTIYTAIRKLPAAHLLVWQAGNVSVRRYWHVEFGATSSDATAEAFLELLTDSIRLRLQADVPVGAFLSGGIDSSAIVALGRSHASESFHTFSVGFEEQYYDERPYAQEVASQHDTEHHEFLLKADLVQLLNTYSDHYDEPFADPAALPTLVLAEASRKIVKVVLTGDGADELFAGYNRYWSEMASGQCARVPRFIRNGMVLPVLKGAASIIPVSMRARAYLDAAVKRTGLLDLDRRERYMAQFCPFRDAVSEHLYSNDFREQLAGHDGGYAFGQTNTNHWLSGVQQIDLDTILPEQMLTKVDRATMAHGLEARVPFLDHRIVEFAAKLPPREMMNFRKLKRFLKHSFRGIVPDNILDRPKHGFQVPLGEWFRGELREFVTDNLSPDELNRHGYFNADYVSGLVKRHLAGDKNHEREIFSLLVFQAWWQRYA
jgi:asparagine synthase (glutamine-hydrolysing)